MLAVSQELSKKLLTFRGGELTSTISRYAIRVAGGAPAETSREANVYGMVISTTDVANRGGWQELNWRCPAVVNFERTFCLYTVRVRPFLRGA